MLCRYAAKMTENKLNPFEDNEHEYVSNVHGDAVDRERQAQNIPKTECVVSDYAHLLHIRCGLSVSNMLRQMLRVGSPGSRIKLLC